jgi:saccharopine dehydrogenase-like NADP-dependent oxidoreductase
MADRAVVFRNGKLGYVDAFTEPSYRKYKYMNREIEFLQHSHEEPIIYGINAKKYYKGLKNAYFKYAGVSMDFAKQINRCGLLIKENIKYKNLTINPLDFICSRIAKAPKYEDEVKKIIASGFYSDVIYAIVEVIGKKQNKKQVVEYHIFSPGLKESFAKRKLTSEQFLTGQSGAVYTDMMINDKISNLGLIFSDEMSISEMKYYLSEIKKLGIKCVKNISSKIPD